MTLSDIVTQLRACNYTCEAGALENNVAFQELVKMAAWKPITVDNIPDLMMSRAQLRRAQELGYEMSYRRTVPIGE
jgi:hypothetical protein